MGKVMTGQTMSLDGFIAGENDDVGHLFKWYSAGDTPLPIGGTDRVFKVSQASADLLLSTWATFGAMVTGRRDFDVSGAWGGKALMDLPMFIVTHQPPQEWVYEGSPFTFVTDGVASAIAQAKQAAGDKNVALGGSTIIQQCLKLGLLDEIHVDLVPVILGKGIRLFDAIETPITLEKTNHIEGIGVTHMTFRVVK